ncbi:MAG: hypothetical protein NC935_07535, partial [Candidatus Omnitrophica bacterium]|nr:hypothetical protein [Candidatus Omnitrophota bacterium]
MKRICFNILLFFYFIFFLLNGLGIFSQNDIFFITFIPNVIFLLLIVFNSKKIFFPFEGLFYLLFLISAIPANFHNQYNLGLSIEGFFFYLNILILIIFFLNNQTLSGRIIYLIIKFTPPFFIILFISTVIFNQWPKNLGFTEYNFFFSFYNKHNHLGDLLGLAIIYSFFSKKIKQALFFLPFFLFSFSRSAMLAIISVFIVYIAFQLFKNYKDYRKNKIVDLLLSLGIFFFSTFFFLIKTGILINKTNRFFEPRFIYFATSIKGIINHPFGIGFFNFGALSGVENLIGSFSSEIHNLLLEIILGGGVMSCIFFSLFLFFFIKEIYRKDKRRFFMVVYLLIIFSFDYVYNIFFFLIFFFIILIDSLPTQKKRFFILDKKIFITQIVFVIFFAFSYFVGRFFYLKGNFNLAANIYFLNEDFYVKSINQLLKEKKYNDAFFYIKNYERFFPIAHDWLAHFYDTVGDCQQAIKHSEKALNYYSLPYFFRLREVFNTFENCHGEDFAYQQLRKSYLLKKINFKNNQDKKAIKNIYKNWCVFDDKDCQKVLGEMVFYYHPKPNTKERSEDLLIKATYTFNNNGFNERFNYQVKKPKDTFRILVLGDGNAFGFLVDTKDNWVEKLEDKLKSQISNLKSKYQKI